MTAVVQPSETRTLGDFVLREKLGEGGFGTVYRAEQRTLERSAVIKVMRPALAAMTDASERFILEARLASRFDHPYAAHVYAFGAEPDGLLWIAMEMVHGTPLGELIARSGPLPLERFIPLMERLCEVVQAAHDQGIVHRDIKPSNVMVIARSGRLIPKLLDFGIAKLIAAGTPAASPASLGAPASEATTAPARGLTAAALEATRTASLTGSPGAQHGTLTVEPAGHHRYPPGLTRPGQLLGSPPYMAPEQWLDPSQVDPRTDQYALAILAYEALTGARPYSATTIDELAECHMQVELPALPAHLPPQLHAVLARAAAKQPALRFDNLDDLAAALRAAAGGSGDTAVPQLPGELRALWLAEAPRPIAEAIAALASAQTAARVADRAVAVAATLAHWLGVLAIACRSRLGAAMAPGGDDMELVRALRRRPLRDEDWLDLAIALARPAADRPALWPIPEQAAFLTGAGPAQLRGLVRGEAGLAVATSEREHQIAEAQVAELAAVLRGLDWLLDYEIARELPAGLELWMGLRGDEPVVRKGRAGDGDGTGRVVVLDADGARVVALSPVVQILAPAPGQPDELFVLRGPGRGDQARLVASPRGFERELDGVWSQLAGGVLDTAPAAAPGGDGDRPPYPGLAAFTRADHASFVGRERDAEDVVNRLRSQRAIAVVGPSGVGKSSFLAAGLVPALPETWAAEVIRPGSDPVAALAAVAARRRAGPYRDQPAEPPPDEPAATPEAAAVADALIAAAQAAEVLVVIVDQAEELFTLTGDAARRAAFAGALARAWTSPRIRVVLGVRDDFLYRLDGLAGWTGALAGAVHLLRVPGRAELERIAAVPARRRGYEFDDPALPAAIAGEVADRPGALPLLAFAAAELWQRRDRQFRRLTRAAYQQIGGVIGALVQHADGVVDAMPAGDRRLVRLAFGRLLTAAGTRTVIGRDQLIAALGAPAAARVVERLIAARLIVAHDDDGDGDGDADAPQRVEIIHEALATMWPRLAAWRRDDAAAIQFHDQLASAARHWSERGKSPGLLWRGDAVRELARWRGLSVLPVTGAVAEFADASWAAARAGRRRRIAALAGGFAALALALAVLGWQNQRVAHQRAVAVRQVAAGFEERARLAVLGNDALHGLLYLGEARRLGQRGAASDLLAAHAARAVTGQAEVIATGLGAISRAELDAGTILTVGDGVARVWDSALARLAIAPLDDVVDAAAARGSIVVLSRAGDLSRIALDGTLHWRLPGAHPPGPAAVWAELTVHVPALDAAIADSIVVSSRGLTAQVRKLADGALVAELTAGAAIRTSVFDPAGRRLATGDTAGEVRIWQLPAGALIATCRGHTATIAQLRFSLDGRRLLSASDDRDVRICDPATGQPLHRLQGHTNRVLAIDLAPDGATIASGSSDGTARLWDAATGALIASLDSGHGVVETVRFSPDGRYLATAGADGIVRISDRAGVALASLQGHAGRLRSVQWDPGSRKLITAGFDGSIRYWDLDRAILASSVQLHQAQITALAVSPDGRWSATGAADGTIVVSDLLAGAVHHALRGSDAAAAAAAVASLWFAPDGGELVAVDRAGGAAVWSIASGQRRFQLGPQITTARFVPGGQAIITGGGDRTVRLWRRDGSERARLAVDAVPANFTFDSAGRYAVFRPMWTDPATDAMVIDVASAELVARLPVEHSGVATAIDATRIATADRAAIRIYELGTWRQLATLSGHTSSCHNLTFLPDGRLVSAGNDLRVLIWGADHALQATLPTGGIRVYDIDATADGRLLVTDGSDGAARIWDTRSYRELLRLPSHHQALERIALTPDGQRLLTGGGDGRVVSWDLGRPALPLAELARLVRCRVPLRLDGDLALPRELELRDPACR